MPTPTGNSVRLTGDARIDRVTQGSSWTFDSGPRVLTYSFSLNDEPGNQPAWAETQKAVFIGGVFTEGAEADGFVTYTLGIATLLIATDINVV